MSKLSKTDKLPNLGITLPNSGMLYAIDAPASITFPYAKDVARKARYGAIPFIVGAILSLGGCATIPPAPKVISVSVPTYVPIPVQLSADCPIAMPKDLTEGELYRTARERRAELEACNADKKAIRGLSGSPAPVR